MTPKFRLYPNAFSISLQAPKPHCIYEMHLRINDKDEKHIIRGGYICLVLKDLDITKVEVSVVETNIATNEIRTLEHRTLELEHLLEGLGLDPYNLILPVETAEIKMQEALMERRQEILITIIDLKTQLQNIEGRLNDEATTNSTGN